MEEIKPMLVAILDRLETESARNEAFRMEMYKFQGEVSQFKGEMLEFKDGMTQFKGEVSQFQDEARENFQDLQQQLDYIAGKMGEHDRDLHVLKRELV